jgi:sarcosine oxidase
VSGAVNQAEVIVIGLGAMGAATAFQLCKRGADVIGIDRYCPPHAFGASWGDTRITRQAIGEGMAYVPLVLRSHEIWRELEAVTGVGILEPTGMLIMQSESRTVSTHGAADFVGSTVTAARAHSIEHQELNTDQLRSIFPQFNIREDHRGYYEPGGGFVRPEAAVRAQLQLAKHYGAQLKTNEQVLDIRGSGSSIEVATDKSAYRSNRVVLTAGPWIPRLLPILRSILRRYRQILYWFEVGDSYEALLPDRFPTFISMSGVAGGPVYGFPAIDGRAGGLKIATEQYDVEAESPDLMERNVGVDETSRMFHNQVRNLLPGVGPNAIRTHACLYTVTPDFDFIIDQAPEMSNVTIVSACSGHGFKHSAAVGESIAQLVATGGSDLDLSSFRLDRFASFATP